jgi:hypothetical protein
MRPLKAVALFLLILFLIPIALRAVLIAFEDWPQAWHDADLSSIGLLPAATDHPQARILILSARASGAKGQFFTHSWIVLKRENAPSWSRYDVVGWSNRGASDGESTGGRWFGNSPVLNRWAPDGRWFGNSPVQVVDVIGAEAATLIPRIEGAIENYEANGGHYRIWPGPNSNTFVAVVLRSVPELGATLPPTAIGKDFRRGLFVGMTDSRTGVEASLWGVLGVKLGWVEGAEVNLLSLVAGVDLRQPGLKLPAFGRVGLSSDTAVADTAANSSGSPAASR